MAQVVKQKDQRGKSFRDQNLTGSDFSHADIRGTNFSNAILVGANFNSALAGQRSYWFAGLVAGLSLFALVAGYIVAYAGALIGSLMVKTDAQPVGLWSGIIALILLIIFSLVVVRKGLGSALGGFALAVALTVVMVAALGEADAISAAIIQAIAIAGAIAGVILGAIVVTAAWMLFKYAGYLTVGLALIGSAPGALEGVRDLPPGSSTPLALTISAVVAVVSIGLIVFISKRVVTGHRNYFVIPNTATALSSLGGTSFRGADLTDADFTEANLKSADFRKAILKRTSWLRSRCLEQCRLQGTYLEDPQIRKLAITRNSPEQNYDYLNLRGLNLEAANLQNASLVGTDFHESSLRNANLAGAKLAKAQLYQTDLTGACLTGAYIQDWGISTETKLDHIACEYVYMRLPTRDDPDPCRKPDNRQESFQGSDFSEFIAPIIKTLGLYQDQSIDTRKVAERFKTLDLFHSAGLDPSAAAIAIQQVSENHPEAQLEVIALENSGNERIRMQAKVSATVDRSKLSQEYFEGYEENKSLPPADLQKLLEGVQERDDQISMLTKLLENALNQPKFYVETYRNEGDFIMAQEKKGNIEISNVHGDLSGVAAAGENQAMTGVSLGVISGTVTSTIEQLPSSSDPDKPGIKELLTQLQAAIEAESELSDGDKAEALAQVKVLAEAGQKPKDSALRKASTTAMKILKGTIASLPDAARLVDASTKLLPAIIALLK